ncbi:MAG: porin family protein [Gemmatimonadetes bacterium]|nr:porin family protein [Gemmatimonadota bacterium]
MGARTGLFILSLAAGLIIPETAKGQDPGSPVQMQVSAFVSGFRYERGPEAKWRASTALRFRVLLRDRFFGELSVATPVISTGPAYCPGMESCPPGTPVTKQTDWVFKVFGASLGFRFTTGSWKPFLGIGAGRMRSEGESSPSWMAFGGLERPISERWGTVLEYRAYRVDWPSEGLSRHHSVGVGLTFTF